ncbi:TIGR04002 family protein [Clostridium sp.]|uniref:TIGR04002 family protein n=1 Tax=Clostridium sp. TaxID=1506 RepID=UPI0025BFD47F|nr:TIGR04002 family protein [Clostridium sp.]
MKKSIKTRDLVLAGLFAAIICISISFHIPTGFNGGYIHLGDTFIYIAAVLLPTPYAMLAAGIGAGLADALSGGMIWVLPTIIIKPIMVLFFTTKRESIICKKNLLAIFIAGIVGWFGYYLAGAIISGSFVAPLATFFIDIMQPIGSGIIFLIAGYSLDRVKIRQRLSIEAK